MKKHICFIFLASFFLLVPFNYGISAVNGDETKIALGKGFIVSPAKVEISLDPGETFIKNIKVLNKLGEKVRMQVEVEDFSPSENKETPIILGRSRAGESLSARVHVSHTPELIRQDVKETGRRNRWEVVLGR